MSSRKSTKHQPTSFIRKTYKILAKSKHNHIISWSDDGFSFVIKDQHSFTNTILPQYFKHRNFASFNRQLNMYDFHKTKEDILEFSHPLFQRNNETLLSQINRKSAEPQVFKASTHELGQRLKKFQFQQNTMKEMLESLEKQYDKIVEQNQILICEVMQSKQREKRIEMYINKIEERKKEEKRKEAVQVECRMESDDYLKLSPLHSDD
jgi:heat shock transcription factor 1